jgi:hypothetical protein
MQHSWTKIVGADVGTDMRGSAGLDRQVNKPTAAWRMVVSTERAESCVLAD